MRHGCNATLTTRHALGGGLRPLARPVAVSELGTTQYARSGDGFIAYQVLSPGSTDVLVVNESVLPLEALHDNPHTASYLSRLAAWGRVIVYDRRGVGLSDPVGDLKLTLDDWVDDAVAVLDAVGSERAAVFSSGPSSGLIALALAARRPERVGFLSLYDAIARYRWAPDHPWGVSAEVEQQIEMRQQSGWGTPRFADRHGRFAATAACHPGFVDWAITWFRRGAGPAAARAHRDVLREADVRRTLGRVTCPALVVNHAGVDDGPHLAEHLPNARYVELQDPCHLLFSPELDHVMAATSDVLGGSPVEPATHRVLTSMLFTDIVGSTARLASLGDRRWGIELDHHYDMVRRQIERFDGQEVKTLGDGFIATFDGPSRAVQCALAIRHHAGERGVAVRAAVHTGEVERRGDDVLGLAVHVTQRMCSLAAGAQILVSRGVVDLVAGSDLRFDHLGDHHLKGLEGRWSVFEASALPQPFLAPAPSPSASVSPRALAVVNGRGDDLSPREREVLAAVATGASNAEIAAALYVSAATIKAHVSHLLTKLGCSNRVQLALHAHSLGMVAGAPLAADRAS